jgi:hypothetical protein
VPQRRDKNGRFAGGGGIGAAVGRRMRLKANEKRVARNASALSAMAPGGKSKAVQTMARKLERSAKVNDKAAKVYKARRGSR